MIVSQEIWERAQEIREARKNKINASRQETNNLYMEQYNVPFSTRGRLALTGMVYCGYCGKRLKNTGYANHWTCKKTGEKKVSYVGRYGCPEKCKQRSTYSQEYLEGIVFATVETYLENLKKIDISKELEEMQTQQGKTIKREIKDLEKEIKNLMADIETLEGTELLKQEDDLVTAQRKRHRCGERGKLVIEGAFLLLQIGQPGGQGGAGGAVFDGAQDVADFAADLSKCLLQGCTLWIGTGRLGLLQAHDGVCELLDVFRPEQQIGSGLHYELFQHILRHIFPGTGAAKAAARAGIVMIDAARGVVAADALHQAAAFAAVQLAGEDIVCLG